MHWSTMYAVISKKKKKRKITQRIVRLYNYQLKEQKITIKNNKLKNKNNPNRIK